MITQEQNELLKRHLRRALKGRGTLTVTEAWEIGRHLGIFKGGEAAEAERALNSVGVRNPGLSRAVSVEERLKAIRYTDYWTLKGKR